MRDAMISIPVGKYNELADLVVELTTRHKVLIETNESLAVRLAEAERERDEYKSIVDQLRHCIDGGATISRISHDLPVLQRQKVGSWIGNLDIRWPPRATASARAVQEPACQHDLQQSAPTVRVWHSMFEPDKQSAECNVCGSRWTIKGVGRG